MLVYLQGAHEIDGKGGYKSRQQLGGKCRLFELAKPMGEFWKWIRWNYTVTEWIPNYGRLRRLKKRVQGQLQRSIIKRGYGHTGRLIYPSNLQKHVIKNIYEQLWINNQDLRYR